MPLPPGARPTITAPIGGGPLVRGTQALVTWTVVPGIAQYLVEFTGPGGQFANPNGSAPDPAKALGSLVVPGTALAVVAPVTIPQGSYQVRVISLDGAGQPVASFSDAVTVVVQ